MALEFRTELKVERMEPHDDGGKEAGEPPGEDFPDQLAVDRTVVAEHGLGLGMAEPVGEDLVGEEAGDDQDEGGEDLEEGGKQDALLPLCEALGCEGALDDLLGWWSSRRN